MLHESRVEVSATVSERSDLKNKASRRADERRCRRAAGRCQLGDVAPLAAAARREKDD